MDGESPRLRMSILGIVVVSLFAALFARLWYLQVMVAPEYAVQAEANRVRVVAEEGPRGRILDAQGRVLVDNRTSLVVTVRPDVLEDLDDRDAVLLRLAEALTRFGVPTKVATIERRMVDDRFNPLQPVPVAIDVPPELELHLAENAESFPAVDVRRELVRSYPHGTLAAHLLGYVGRINSEELQARQGTAEDPRPTAKPYQPDSPIGKGGVERTFEDDLRGYPGRRVIEIDANNRPVRTIDYTPPRPGYDIQLTIDIDVQRVAEVALAEQLEQARGGRTDTGVKRAPAGAVVVLDPNDGDVVALASYPTFEPEEFVNGISQARFDQLTAGAESDNPLIDRTIQGLYAPGSTFKPFTAYAAMTSGLIDGRTTFNDRGSYDLGTQSFRNAGGRAHGIVNVSRSLTVSSNTFYAWIADRFYSERDRYGDAIQNSARQFGFGAQTGIALPSERAGLIPDPAQKAQRNAANPQAFPYGEWFPGDTVNTSVGQGDVLVTPLQLALGYSVLANGGTVYQPNIVERVLRSGGDPADPAAVVRTVDTVVRSQIPMPPEVRRPLVEGLAAVTTSREGTATATFAGFDQSSFDVAGKTGTAEVRGRADSSVFAAWGPVESPSFVAAAILEESGFGAEAAGPVLRRVFEQVSGQPVTEAGEIRAGVAD